MFHHLGNTANSLATSWTLCLAVLTRLCVAMERCPMLSVASRDPGRRAWHISSAEEPSNPRTQKLHGLHQIPPLRYCLCSALVMMTYISHSKSFAPIFVLRFHWITKNVAEQVWNGSSNYPTETENNHLKKLNFFIDAVATSKVASVEPLIHLILFKGRNTWCVGPGWGAQLDRVPSVYSKVVGLIPTRGTYNSQPMNA